jgi:hypothetical protein
MYYAFEHKPTIIDEDNQTEGVSRTPIIPQQHRNPNASAIRSSDKRAAKEGSPAGRGNQTEGGYRTSTLAR